MPIASPRHLAADFLLESARVRASLAVPNTLDKIRLAIKRPSKALLSAIERGQHHSISLRGMSENAADELVTALKSEFPGINFFHTVGQFEENKKRFLLISIQK